MWDLLGGRCIELMLNSNTGLCGPQMQNRLFMNKFNCKESLNAAARCYIFNSKSL